MDSKGLQNIKKMYEKLTYFDQYGASVILFVIITIILFILVSYCYAKINAQPIIDDWPNQRCKPNIIPFAGFITHPDGISAVDYTSQNFTYCTQNILSSITGIMVEPITFIVNMIVNILNDIKQAINDIRAMFDKVRTFFQTMAQELMGRIMNMMIPLQKIIISFKDLVGKIQGTMTAGLFTLLGSYYTLKSLMGAIAQFIIIILIALAAMIIVFWIVPFTWGMAISMTAVFIAIAIPMAIILAFMIDVLKVQTSLSLPSVKCFDEDTLITMNDGSKKKIIDIKVGDILMDNNVVTAFIKVETKGSIMYNLHNVIVSDSHIVKYNNNWIPVSKHPDAIKNTFYVKPYLYCLNTINKTIIINDITFTDWDEIYGKYIQELTNLNIHIYETHKYLDGGFHGNTHIRLKNGIIKHIKNVEVGDILEHNESVYGIVEINGADLSKQYKYNLGEFIFEGGPLQICDKKIDYSSTIVLDENLIQEIEKEDKLYHLLTNKKSFHINNINFYDYNASIDLFLEKNKRKLLSMKYV
jgi:hypothetical protein